MRFKKNKVWVATDADANPLLKDGKMLIKYQLNQDYEYWVKAAAVVPLDSPSMPDTRKQKKSARTPARTQVCSVDPAACGEGGQDHDVICIFSDGASAGNPGPSGIGVVLRYGRHQKEISAYIGMATNNIAELKAIEQGVRAVKNKDLPVRLFTDSTYAHGVLALGWKSRKNKEIVASIQQTLATFKDLKFFKIKGHSGHPDNERADYLARLAIKQADIP